MMRRLIAGTICLSAIFMTIYGQHNQPRMRKDQVVLSNSRPAVYLTFEREGIREPVHVSESNRGIWLRLHNNTKWAISFCTVSLYIPPKVAPLPLADGRHVLGLNDGVDVSVCHGVEEPRVYKSKSIRTVENENRNFVQEPERQVGYDTGHVSSSAWLPSGKSVVFSIPREHLASGTAIFVRFNYEWEYGERSFRSDEVEHRVYFRATELPKKAQ